MNPRDPVAVLGIGGHGKSLGDFLTESGYQVVYLDDSPKWCLGGSDFLKDENYLRKYRVAIGIGDNKLRHHFSMVVIKSGGRLQTVRHHTAVISRSAVLGCGCQYFPNSIVGTDVKIENFVIVNSGASVAHDSIIRDGAQIADGGTLGGHVIIGKRTLVGLNATVLPKVRIGDDCVIGAGAVVTRDVSDGATVKGNPAR